LDIVDEGWWRGDAGRDNEDDAPGAAADPDLPILLLRDLEVVEELVAAGFSGSAWQRHVNDAGGYGCRVVYLWGVSGELFPRLRSDASLRGTDRLPRRLRFTAAEVKDLLADVIGPALAVYRVRLQEGRWRPEKGRRLRSYFLQQLKFQVVRRYWQWREASEAQQRRPEVELGTQYQLGEALHGDVYSWAEPEASALLAAEIRDRVAVGTLGDPLARRIVAMEVAHFEDEEIAAVVGLTAKAVELRLRRFRERASARRYSA
jgi:DNA-directed RNA polymerase specialized sigma24 family protein